MEAIGPLVLFVVLFCVPFFLVCRLLWRLGSRR